MLYVDTEYHNSNPKFQLMELYMSGYGEGEGEGGPIPEFLHHQHSLQILEISNIGLRGRFPCWLLANNTSLMDLSLTNNLLSGDLQLPTKPHVSLTTLNISDNFFSGYIPSQIGVLFPSLSVIDMSGNEFNGSLPKSLCNYVSSLRELDISHSHISGALPKCMGNMARLEILNLSNNNISRTLPSKFKSSVIAIVYLSKNRLHGSLKEAFHNCSAMWILDLGYNNFSGSIPSWIQTLPNLEYLILGYNNFQGKIPNELCKLKGLSFLDLSHNDISGHIPSCLNTTSFWSMIHGSLKYGELELGMKGSRYVYQKRILQFISGIDISCNHLVGQIPHQFGNLSGIEVLNLSHNNLIGGIPVTFSNLKEIESLDLSYNNLQGPIPHQPNQLTSLEVFNVSYNNLSGETPDRVAQFATFDESCYIGNPFLCGWPLSKSCFTKRSPPSNAKISPNKEETKDAFIDMEMFYVSFGVTYVVVLLTLVAILCINPYWRRFWFYHEH